MTRVALYTRVSTEEQAKEGFSLDAQLRRLRAHAVGQGWTVAAEYTDEGQSARTTRRPAYQRMMAESDTWDTLLVLKMDRIHRNSRNFLAMMDDLKRQGKEFASATESLDTSTAMGRFVMDTIQRIAQLESETTGERTEQAMLEKARQGSGGLGGPAPYGYRWENSKLVPVPEEAKLVRMMFMAWDEGHTPGRIAMNLTLLGYRTRQGSPWTYWNVRDILHQDCYRGHLKWNGIVQQNAHEPIITEG